MNIRLCGTCKAYQPGATDRPPQHAGCGILALSGTCRRISPSRFGFPAVDATGDWCLEWEKDPEKTCDESKCVLPAGHEPGCVNKDGEPLAAKEDE